MGKEKYVAYVSTYTMGGDQHGIKIYDVDMENGRLIPKDEVEITNSSYVTISHNRKILPGFKLQQLFIAVIRNIIFRWSDFILRPSKTLRF